MRTVFLVLLLSYLLCACSTSRRIHQLAQKSVLQDSVLQNAHVGISIYEPATGRWWYNWQGDKYFVPASNIKIATCYAAMNYLGDSLPAARVAVDEKGRLRVFPSGDPTLLHPEFRFQPLFKIMKQHNNILWYTNSWQSEIWGSGWS